MLASSAQQFPWQMEALGGLTGFLLAAAALTPRIAPFVAKRVEKHRRRRDGDLGHEFYWGD